LAKIKLLFKIGYVYHKAAFDPVIELLLNNDKYDVWFSLEYEKRRRLIFDFKYRPQIVDQWQQQVAAGEVDLQTWWTLLDDPVLDSLIERATQGNLTLRIAVARDVTARKQAETKQASLFAIAQAAQSAVSTLAVARPVASTLAGLVAQLAAA